MRNNENDTMASRPDLTELVVQPDSNGPLGSEPDEWDMALHDRPPNMLSRDDEDRAGVELWDDTFDWHRVIVRTSTLGDAAREAIEHHLTRFGLVVIRYEAVDVPARAVLEHVVADLGQPASRQNLFEGSVKRIRPVPDGLSASGDTSHDIGWHVDGTQHRGLQPELLVFAYVTEPKVGGFSTFADGARILASLEPGLRRRVLLALARPDAGIFRKRGMTATAPLVAANGLGGLALRLRFDDVLTVHPEVHWAFETLRTAYADPRFTLRFRPREGDLVVFDNHRLVHGRSAIHGACIRAHDRVWIPRVHGPLRRRIELGARPVEPALLGLMHVQQR